MCPLLANLLLPLRKSNSLLEVVGSKEFRAFLLWIVVLVFIISKHTIGCKFRSYLTYGILDKVTPFYGNTFALLVLVIESRSDLVFYDVVDQLSIQFVLVLLVFIGTFLREHPAGIFAVTFYPPAIEYAKVHHPVHSGLFSTSTRGFERTCRRVHPYIHPLDKRTRQVHIVVGEEDNFA